MYDSYKGEWYQTGLWPADKQVDFVGKRSAVIGTGATGIQVVPSVAHSASQLVVFKDQRTPNYVLPARNHPLEDSQAQAIKRDYYQQVFQRARKQAYGADIVDITCTILWSSRGRNVWGNIQAVPFSAYLDTILMSSVSYSDLGT